MRTGIIAKKLGMTRVFSEKGEHIPVTLLQVESAQVVSAGREPVSGKFQVQVGAGACKVKNVSKAMRGHFAKSKVEPKAQVKTFTVSESALLPVGAILSAGHFVAGQYVDVQSTSKGRGFAGGMKRHNFAGLEASHGVSISHRSSGSAGQCQDPGRTFKGKKMPGHYGDATTTLQSLQVVLTDAEKGLIAIRGGVPGAKDAVVYITDAVKRSLPANAPFPAGLVSEGKAEAAQEDVQSAPAEETESSMEAAVDTAAADDADKGE